MPHKSNSFARILHLARQEFHINYKPSRQSPFIQTIIRRALDALKATLKGLASLALRADDATLATTSDPRKFGQDFHVRRP
jgi:hypothetical protein